MWKYNKFGCCYFVINFNLCLPKMIFVIFYSFPPNDFCHFECRFLLWLWLWNRCHRVDVKWAPEKKKENSFSLSSSCNRFRLCVFRDERKSFAFWFAESTIMKNNRFDVARNGLAVSWEMWRLVIDRMCGKRTCKANRDVMRTAFRLNALRHQQIAFWYSLDNISTHLSTGTKRNSNGKLFISVSVDYEQSTNGCCSCSLVACDNRILKTDKNSTNAQNRATFRPFS